MKRPKSLPSRRQRALRRMGVLLLFLLLLPALYQPSFTPRQVIRASENLLGLERTEVVGQTELLSHQVTFSANEDVLLVTVFQPLRPLGPGGASGAHGAGRSGAASGNGEVQLHAAGGGRGGHSGPGAGGRCDGASHRNGGNDMAGKITGVLPTMVHIGKPPL